jgi:hypothetical protein
MEYLKKRNLFYKCCDVYDSSGMSGFESFADNFDCDNEEKNYLIQLREILRISNSSGLTRISILSRDSSLELIISDLLYQANHILEPEMGRWIKREIEIFYFNREYGRCPE